MCVLIFMLSLVYSFIFYYKHFTVFSFIAVPFLICVHNYFSELLDRRHKNLFSNFIILELPLLKKF